MPTDEHLPDGNPIITDPQIVEFQVQYIGNETYQTSTQGLVLVQGRGSVRHWKTHYF